MRISGRGIHPLSKLLFSSGHHLLLFELRAEHSRFAFFLEPVALALDVEHSGMVKKTVEDSRGQDLVVEDYSPVGEDLVGSEDQAGLLVAAGQEAEKEPRFLPAYGQISHFIDDQHLGVEELSSNRDVVCGSTLAVHTDLSFGVLQCTGEGGASKLESLICVIKMSG